jgi:aryl-alcohol dehydrogenase-like predicted oxidoreductase
MKYRKLGSTGLKVSEIGFGAWGIGGEAYGSVDDNVSIETLQLAFDLGITFYDTSDLYGRGHSEEIIGIALKDVREEVILATKVGTLPHFGFNMPQDFSPKYINEGIDESLNRLQTDYIDLYQLHSPPIEIINHDIINTLEKLQEEGKIRAFGISVRSPDDAIVAVKEFGFKAIQVNYNLIDQRALKNGLFDLTIEKNVGVIVRTPLCFGYLSGKLTGKEKFKGKDHRSNWPIEQLQRWAKAPELFNFLIEDGNRTLVQSALKFCLSHESVSTVIVGMMNPNEVKENIKVSKIDPLTDEELSKIKIIYDTNVFYDKFVKEERKKK